MAMKALIFDCDGVLAAGANCIVTTSAYTRDEDFSGASRVVKDLGDPPAVNVTIADLQRLCA